MVVKNDRFRENQAAFEDVIGNPFALEEVTGHYITVNTRSTIRAMDNNFDLGKGTGNAARPSFVDFSCDVERVIDLGLVRLANGDKDVAKTLQVVFVNTYITEDNTGLQFNAKERSELEQVMGRLFLARHISPVSRYFLTIRQKLSRDAV